MNTKIFRILFSLIAFTFLASCDKDFNTIGASIVGDDHFGFEKYEEATVMAYTQKTGPIQSSNLDINAFGTYNNPQFGRVTANLATQVQLSTVSPTLTAGLTRNIVSVVLYVPYNSSLVSTDTDGNNTYKLNNITEENSTSKFKLSVFENGYFLRDTDPNTSFLEGQRQYTNQQPDFENNKKGTFANNAIRLNNSSILNQNDEFQFSASEYVDVTPAVGATAAVTTRTPPGMRINLDGETFKQRILNAPADKLTTNPLFKEYFRGLYFKAEQSGTDAGRLALLNFRSGTITIKYTEATSLTDATLIDKSLILNLGGNSVSLLANDFGTSGTAYNAINPIRNTSDNDQKLFIKGGEGSVAILKLFGDDLHGEDGITGSPNGVADELDQIRKKGWLINEANLSFYVDKPAMQNSPDPDRLYLYDATNLKPMIDYFFDGTVSTTPNFGKFVHGGIIEKDNQTVPKGIRYKIRITNYVRSLVKFKDSTNVKLGLSVTQSIDNINSGKLRTANSIKFAPISSVVNPYGTILYGSSLTPVMIDGIDKRLKLEIWYTKPE